MDLWRKNISSVHTPVHTTHENLYYYGVTNSVVQPARTVLHPG